MEGWGEEAPSKAWSGGECGNVVRQQARQRCPRRSWSSEWGQVRQGLGKVHSDPDSLCFTEPENALSRENRDKYIK